MKSVTQGNLKIEIDRELCIGAASCAIIAPKTFTLDQEGKVDLLEGDWEDQPTIEAAAESCPVRAITLIKLEQQSQELEQKVAKPEQSQAPTSFDATIIMDRLKTVLDPELGINVVDLGLVYGVYQHEQTITIDMTLTTPGCPLINEFVKSIHDALISLDGVEDVVVNLTFDPPWNPSKMSQEAAEELGFLL